MRALLAAVAFALVCVAVAAAEPPLTNADVIKLVRAGVSADAIVAKIQSSASAFKLDTDSLVALAGEKVPDAVIKAMMASTPAPTPAPAPPASPAPAAPAPSAVSVTPVAVESPKVAVTEVVIKGIYRTRGICTARGDVTMNVKKFTFKPVDTSPLCSEEAFGKTAAEFAWDDVSRLCFEYAASGEVQVWLKDGSDMSFKAMRGAMEDIAARIKALRPDLQVRCDD